MSNNNNNPTTSSSSKTDTKQSSSSSSSPVLSVDETLDLFHKSASIADGETYFGLFAQENAACFIGTDAKERWTLEEFRKFAMPYFAKGQGWTYIPRERHISYANMPNQQTQAAGVAWFDEILDSKRFGVTRSSGVLVQEQEKSSDDETTMTWKIAQYHLTVPIPNDLMDQVVALIRDDEGEDEDEKADVKETQEE